MFVIKVWPKAVALHLDRGLAGSSQSCSLRAALSQSHCSAVSMNNSPAEFADEQKKKHQNTRTIICDGEDDLARLECRTEEGDCIPGENLQTELKARSRHSLSFCSKLGIHWYR
jgi:hypothetical protein